MKRVAYTIAGAFIRMTVLTVTSIVLIGLYVFMPTMATLLGIGIIVAALVSLGFVIGHDSTQKPETYYGNQDKLVRPADGTTQVTYKGR